MKTMMGTVRGRSAVRRGARLATASAVLALGAPPAADAQTMLDRLLGAVTRRKEPAPAGPAARGAADAQGSARSDGLAAATPAQAAALDRLLAQPLQDAAAAADRAAAAALIRAVVVTGACATAPQGWAATNRFQMAPRNYDGYDLYRTPMSGTRYHDRSRCLDVTRLSEWSKPARNALRFRAAYVSESSGEAGGLYFVLQKDAGGEWLVREFGS